MADSNTPQKKELIDAVDLKPLQHSNHISSDSTTNSNTSEILLWASLVILLLLAITVIFLLPKAVNKNISIHYLPKKELLESGNVTKTVPEATQIVIEPEVQQQTNNPNEDVQAKADVEALLAKLINIESNLQNHAVKKWAPEEFAQAVEQGQLGDEYFRRRKYVQAIEQFEIAIVEFEELEQRIEPTLKRALTRGEQALTQADQVTATQQFELALAIDSNNIRAKNGLQRASTIKELFVILQRASSFESHGQLQQAKFTYQEAVILDPLSEEAKSSLARVESKLNTQAFEQAMATGYRNLQNGQYSDARAAFNSAKKIMPNSKEPTIGLNKVSEAIRQEKIANLLFEADHFAELQKWQQAATSYEKVLQLDSHHQLAQQELQNNLAKAKVLTDLRIALDSVDQLYKDKVLASAKDLLLRIEDIESPGSIIENQYEQLSQLVRIATTPITINLESNNNTQVTVFKIARLGTFSKHQLQLRPGPYTIIGTRNGYRDVRVTIQVSPENNNSTILISCEEPI